MQDKMSVTQSSAGPVTPVQQYRRTVGEPWGRMFYDLLFSQLPASDRPMKILDVGAGFCITAAHLAENNDVTALEPSEEMRSLRVGGRYRLIEGGTEKLYEFSDSSFDMVICHNVLDYIPEKSEILKEFCRVVKKGGSVSIVKHNLAGRVFGAAVPGDDPKTALALLDGKDSYANIFGKRSIYSDDDLSEQMAASGMRLEKTYGIRSFFGLSQNNDIKYTDEWYRDMLALEMRVSEMPVYMQAAYFHHLIFRKEIS